MKGLAELRNAFEHADERAMGYIARGVQDQEKAWNSIVAGGRAVIADRKVRYRRWSLSLDKPATDIFIALRRFLRAAWLELCR